MKSSEFKQLIKEELSKALKEAAVSKAQQQAAGIALAYKKGDVPASKLKDAGKAMSKMSEKELEKLAGTKQKGLPDKKKSAKTENAKQVPLKRKINEAPITPKGPDGTEITDPKVVQNLNMAIKAVDSSLRPKLVAMLEDPGAAKALTNAGQRAALIGAIAIAFGISAAEFGQIVGKVKSMLPEPKAA